MVGITGPANQVIILHNSVMVNTPNSPMVATRRRMDLQAADMQARMPNYHPKQFPPLYGGGIHRSQDGHRASFIPQFNARSQFNHGPAIELDRIISCEDLPHPMMPDVKAAAVTYTYHSTQNGTTRLLRTEVRFSMGKIANGDNWQLFVGRSFTAPDESFDKELPIMRAIGATEKVDVDRLMQVGQEENRQLQQMGQVMIDTQRKIQQSQYEMFKEDNDTRYRIGQEQHDAQMEGYAQHNRQWQMDEWQKSRNAADYVETIRGTRTVYDTVTGASGYANLTDVNGVVNALNEAGVARSQSLRADSVKGRALSPHRRHRWQDSSGKITSQAPMPQGWYLRLVSLACFWCHTLTNEEAADQAAAGLTARHANQSSPHA